MEQRKITLEPEETEQLHKLKVAGGNIHIIAKVESGCLLNRKWVQYSLTEYEAALPIFKKTTQSKVELI